ncbi:MAG: MltA domain-containing protein [Pseudomonadota bacterium]
MSQTGGMRLKPVDFADLRGWAEDTISEAIPPLLKSCRLLMLGVETDPPNRPIAAGHLDDWRPMCIRLQTLAEHAISDDGARAFFKEEFQAYRVSQGESETGGFTGYFEIELTGSLKRSSPDQVPLYKLPSEALRHQPRADIVAGGLEGQGLELIWVDDPIAAFFLQVQGSGKVLLTDGADRRVRYAGFNGFGYRSIGRKLVEDGELDPEEVSMQAIIAWMRAHPEQRQGLMNHNRSFVFFDWRDGGAAQGAQGVDLTPGRSLAIDPEYIPYGAPLWLETTDPVTGAALNRLMIAQDKGGAIKGAVRGDFFWGTGPTAGEYAGLMNQEGQYFLFLPKGLNLNLRPNGSFE